ncbi:MAG TPA: histidine kinase N-terminal 7TM domain-containing protein, partial [Ktedonobacteraceae bacterium]|nr:histidine kinase N-terminal 7TM domain-containing protein [Ktedonobacteraceae bacterium]
MHWHVTPYVLPMIISAIIAAALARSAWHRRAAPGAVSFCLLMLAVAQWSLAYALELASPDLPTTLFWDNLTWFGGVCAPSLWLAFTLQYTGRSGWLTRRTMIILGIEPLFTLLLVWTNQFHGLIESNIRLAPASSFSALVVTFGPWYWINIAYSYLLLLLGTIVICVLIQTLMRSARLYRGQASALLIAVVAPWMGNALTVFGWNPFPRLDLTPFAFTVTGVAMAWSLFGFRLLDIVPVAHEAVFEGMSDAVIVVDEQHRIVGINLSAQRLVSLSVSEGIGRPFTDVFATWPDLVKHYDSATEVYAEVTLGEGEARRYFDLHISPLYRRNGHLAVAGRLIVLNDITEHKRAERALRESEERFRNIFEEAPIGMAVVGLDGTLLQVNKAFCEMLGYCEQELMAHNLSTITHPDDLGKDGLLAAQVLKGAITSYKVEKRYLRQNGETLWADLTSTVLRNQDGKVLGGLIMLENIIERKRAKLLEEERHHVAYELHDGLAQVAASAHHHLQAFASHYRPRSPSARRELDRALELAQLSVKEARRLIAGLRPTALDDFGLATALRLQVEAYRADGWTITYNETLGSERLPPTLETTLFGVAQEALTNIRKHACATQISLTLARQKSTICLEVQDWGCGFEPLAVLHEVSPGDHLGLREMQERVELVGGHFKVSSRPGSG